MITYFYWIAANAFAIFTLWLLGRMNKWKAGFISALIILLAAWLAYYFHFEQVFVKRYGGIMSISVPDGQLHISATWKDDHLWIENYDPKANICYFNEYSKGNLLQGQVVIKNCNPLKRESFGSVPQPESLSTQPIEHNSKGR